MNKERIYEIEEIIEHLHDPEAFIEKISDLSEGENEIYLTTEDCVDVEELDTILQEFGVVIWTNPRTGLPLKEIIIKLHDENL